MLNQTFTRRDWLKAASAMGIAGATSFSLTSRAPAGPAAAQAGGIRGQIVLSRASNAWMAAQVQEPCILPNPKVKGRLVMFFSGVALEDRVVCAVGKAWADAGDPFRWHQDGANPIFRPAARGWDSRTIRLDNVLYVAEEDAYYIYYSGSTGNVQGRIGLAVCPAGKDGYSEATADAITRHGDEPVLAPEPAAPFHEEMVSQSAVLRQWDAEVKRWRWYMYYSYRGKDGLLPGLRLATSHDGKTWARQFNADDPRGMGQIFRSTPDAFYEWHQAFKLGETYVLSMEVGVNRGERWRMGLAVSKGPAKGWQALDLDTALQTKWTGLYDDRTMYHVATPALHRIGDRWYLYAQACGRPASGNYIQGEWEMWCMACDRRIATLPGYGNLYIPGGPGGN